MSPDDMRNTLIVEMTAHSTQTDYQSFNDFDLAGMGAVMVFPRGHGQPDARNECSLDMKSSAPSHETGLPAGWRLATRPPVGAETHISASASRSPSGVPLDK
jgi:hypothetical protein